MEDTPVIKKRRLRRAEASKYLESAWGIKRTTKTLAKDAVLGTGPEFLLMGRFPVYETESLDAWAASLISRRKFRSTSQYGRSVRRSTNADAGNEELCGKPLLPGPATRA
jgi:hypothetical protein